MEIVRPVHQAFLLARMMAKQKRHHHGQHEERCLYELAIAVTDAVAKARVASDCKFS